MLRSMAWDERDLPSLDGPHRGWRGGLAPRGVEVVFAGVVEQGVEPGSAEDADADGALKGRCAQADFSFGRWRPGDGPPEPDFSDPEADLSDPEPDADFSDPEPDAADSVAFERPLPCSPPDPSDLAAAVSFCGSVDLPPPFPERESVA